MVTVTEPGIVLENYWAFCDAPGLDTSALSLARLIVCFACTILSIPYTRRKLLGVAIGATWVLSVAAVFEALWEVVTLAVWTHTDPQALPFYAMMWTPQATAYNVFVDAAGVVSGVLLALVLGNLPAWCAGSVPSAGLERDAFRDRKWLRSMRAGLDTFFFLFLAPFLFALIGMVSAVFLVKYAAKPWWAFRAPAMVITIILAVELLAVWIFVRNLAVRYVAYINSAELTDVDGIQLGKKAGVAGMSNGAVHFAGARINVVWGTTLAISVLVGVLCWGKWMPGQYGLYMQPLVVMAAALVMAMIVRVLLGVGKIADVKTTSYETPNFFPGMGRHLMTNCKVDPFRRPVPAGDGLI